MKKLYLFSLLAVLFLCCGNHLAYAQESKYDQHELFTPLFYTHNGNEYRSAAGAPHRFTYKTIQEAIREAGFEPQLRTQLYEFWELPQMIEEQVIDY